MLACDGIRTLTWYVLPCLWEERFVEDIDNGVRQEHTILPNPQGRARVPSSGVIQTRSSLCPYRTTSSAKASCQRNTAEGQLTYRHASKLEQTTLVEDTQLLPTLFDDSRHQLFQSLDDLPPVVFIYGRRAHTPSILRP